MKRIKGTTIRRNNTKRISNSEKNFHRRQKLETTTGHHLSSTSDRHVHQRSPKRALIKLLKRGHKISISNISIVYNETITTIQTHESTLLLTAFKLRSLLSDFIDCLTPNI
jgi:hypothetical protein